MSVPLDPDFPGELGDLVGALADGTITAEQEQELATILRRSQAARQYYSDYLDLHSELHGHFGGVGIGLPDVLMDAAAVQRPGAAPKRFSWMPIALAAAAAVVIGFFWLQKGDDPVIVEDAVPVPKVSARLADAADVEWVEPLAIGEPLGDNIYELTAGTAEIGFASGASLLVTAPARLSVLGENAVELTRGVAYARVPTAAVGFRVNTPAGSVIDLGTEFGVRVAEDGALETHVVKGLVRMLNADETQAVPIAAGEARMVHPENAGEIRKIAFAGERFPKVLPQGTAGMPDGIRWEMLPSDKGVVYAKRPDDSVAYTAKLMPSDADGPSWQLTEVGSAMFFDGVNDYLQTDFLGVGDDKPRTVAFWAKVPAAARPAGKSVVPMISWGSFERDGGVWQISWNGKAAEGKVGGLRIGAWKGQVIGKTDLRDGKWHHLAVVMNGDDMATGISLYVDGELEETSMHNVKIRTLLIENMRIGRSIDNKSHFRGWLADVHVYEGALSAGQIRQAAKSRKHLEK